MRRDGICSGRIARLFAALGLVALVAACAGAPGADLPPPEVLAQSAYRGDAPPALTLITVINNRTGGGGHSALKISGAQEVIFDPAGSYRPDYVTVYGDVLYGIDDRQFRAYRSAHARNTHHVVMQTLPVSAQTAARALALAQARGTVPSAFCARSTSEILRALPGFEGVQVTFFPARLMEQIAAVPGVQTARYYEDDAGHVLDGIPDALPVE